VALQARMPVLVFSLEMSTQEVTSRLLCAEARVDSRRVRTGQLTDDDWKKLSRAVGNLGQAGDRVFIDDNPAVTVTEIRAKARRLTAEHGRFGLIVVDYLQLMSGSRRHENRNHEVAEISRGLKVLARELDVPVIALSQLNRGVESRNDKRPTLADLRDSGSVEQDADVVAFIYRDALYDREKADDGSTELIVAKHRNGPVGVVHLTFIPRLARFESAAL
jgi:replicative DNA helicase